MWVAVVSVLMLWGETPPPAAAAPAPAPVMAPVTAPVTGPVTAPMTSVSHADMTSREKVVCRSIEVTGSRFSRAECHTRAEWDEMARSARDFVDKATTGACTGATCH